MNKYINYERTVIRIVQIYGPGDGKGDQNAKKGYPHGWWDTPFRVRRRRLVLGKPVDEAGQATFEVGGLVLVPGIALGESIDHTNDFGQEFLSFGSVRHLPQLFDGRTGGFLVIAVGQALFGVLTDSFLSGLMLCHVVY